MSGGSTISNVAPAAGNLRVQTSVYGSVIPVVYGTTRISGNLAWFGGFQAIPHTTTESSGGKGGGGVTTQNTTFTYQAAVLMVLCEGPISAVLSAWRGKQRYSGTAASSVGKTYNETSVVPGGARQITVSQAGAFQNDVQVTDQSPDPYDTYANAAAGM